MSGSRGLYRFVRYTLCERTPGGTGSPSASTASTITRSSVRCIPEPLKQPIAVTPPSEVPHMFATGAFHVSSAARRAEGRSGSAIVRIRRGRIRRRPELASSTSRLSIEGYVARLSPPTALSPSTICSSGRPTLNRWVWTAPVANVSARALVKCVAFSAATTITTGGWGASSGAPLRSGSARGRGARCPAGPGRPPPAAHPARAPGGDSVQLIAEVGVALQPRDVRLDVGKTDLGVGDDRVPVGHQLGLGDPGQCVQAFLVER